MVMYQRTPPEEDCTMTIQQRNAFDNLLFAWRTHQDLRNAGAPLGELNDSRIRLDAARLIALSAH